MQPDQFGVYTNTNGTKYYIDGNGYAVNLTYYNPQNGDYAEQGSNIIFNANGQNTGRTTTDTAAKPGTTWLDVINSALNTAGSIFGNKPASAQNTPVYTPYPGAAPVKKDRTALIVVSVLLAGCAIGYGVYRSKKGKAK